MHLFGFEIIFEKPIRV